ncbi:MAG: hypothetical protein GY803_21980 [Chloroflexi bacterium]|nr:hypothetical protein [Chloroflexota bacterium]
MAENFNALATATRAYYERWRDWLEANPDANRKLVERLMTQGEPPPDQRDAAVVDAWKPGERARVEFEKLRQVKRGYSHTEKMVNTIVAIVDAELSGRGVTAVFGRPETCSKNIYHTKWKYDPDFKACLTAVRGLATEWKDGEAGRAIATAAKMLKMAAPKAVQKAIDSIDSYDPNVALRASLAVLDRGDVETAVKSTQVVDGEMEVKADDVKQSILGKMEQMRRALQRDGEQDNEETEPAT